MMIAKLLQGNSEISISLGSVTRALFSSFGDVFVILIACVGVCTFEEAVIPSSLYRLVLGGKDLPRQPPRDSAAIPKLYYGYAYSTPTPSWRGNSGL